MDKDKETLLKLINEILNKGFEFESQDAKDSDLINNNTINESFDYLYSLYNLNDYSTIFLGVDEDNIKMFIIHKLPHEAIDYLNRSKIGKLRDFLVKNSIYLGIITFVITTIIHFNI